MRVPLLACPAVKQLERPMNDAELLDQFVRALGKLANLNTTEAVPIELDDGMDDSPWAIQKWKPAAIRTESPALDELYRSLPVRFPPLYEQLVLSYRWLEVELNGFLSFCANPPGPSLDALMSKITADAVFVHVLFPLGLIPFGKADDGCYDPICFDTNRRGADGDCPIVRLEHEAILCGLRIGESWEIADSFRSLVKSVIETAAKAPDAGT
jgi:hypothetical protein